MSVTGSSNLFRPFFNDPIFRRFFGQQFGVPRERVQNSLGSGVLVSAEGVVVTNYHVIRSGGESEITVALNDGREFPAKLILKDEQTDLAVLPLGWRWRHVPRDSVRKLRWA